MKRLLLFLLLVVTISITTSCVKVNTDENEATNNSDNQNIVEKEDVQKPKEVVPAFGGELKVSIRNPNSLNPLINEDRTIDALLKLVYDSLFELNEDQKPVKSLVDNFEMNDTGSYLTLHLKNDIVFHNGEPLLAEDVIYSINTILEAEHSIYKSNVANIQRTSAIDDKTCRIYFKQPYAFSLYDLTFPIIKKEIDHNKTPIGTGAYAFASYDSMKQIELKANPNWFKGNLYVENIKAVITRDPEVDLSSFEQKVIDVLNPSKFDWQHYAQKSDVTLTEYITYYYDFIGFNFNHPVLANKEIRKIIAHAINREKLIDDFYMNHAVLTEYPLHPKSWLLEENTLVYPYDVEQAKKLLSDNGWADSDQDGILDKSINGIKVDLKLSLLVNQNNPIRTNIASSIKTSLEKIGFVIELEALEMETYNNQLLSNDFDMVLAGYKLSPVPDFTFAFHSQSINDDINFIHYKSEKMDKTLTDIFNAINDESLSLAMDQFKAVFADDLPYLSLYFRTSAILTHDTVYGTFIPSTYDSFKGIETIYLDH